jgi:hypothetical protein
VSVDDKLDTEFAAASRPESGDKLIGKVVEIGERLGYNDEPYPIITVQPEHGEPLAVHAFHTVLRNELARQRPQIGEMVGIKYEGQFATETGRGRYHRYRVHVDRPQQAFSWDHYGNEPAPETPQSDIPPDSTYGKPPQDLPVGTDDIPF